MLPALRKAPPPSVERSTLRVVPDVGHEPRRAEALGLPILGGVILAVALGVLVRASHVLSAGFPLNDGGLFLVMIENLRQAGYALPDITTYNSAEIPFAYPPLGLYAAVLLTDMTPLSTLDVLRFLPLTISTLTIPAFFLLARSFLGSERSAVAATIAFALLPRSFMWTIMGGGLTRSFGLLFTVLALQQIYLLYTRQERRYLPGTIVFAGLTILSHLEMSLLLATSTALMFAAHGRNRAGVWHSVLATAGILALTAPWWTAVTLRHGTSTLLSAGQSRSLFSAEALVNIVRFDVTNAALFDVLAILGVLGVLACLAGRRFFLPAWLLLIGLAAPWILPTFALIPLSLLVGIGAVEVLLPFLERLERPQRLTLVRPATDGSEGAAVPKRAWLPVAVFGGILCYTLLSAVVTAPKTLVALPEEERVAMAWIAENTPESSRFIVLSAEPWWRDRTSEWFPALAGRASVGTAQGFEWLPDGAFARQVEFHAEIQACAAAGPACLEEVSDEFGRAFDHVYVSKRAPSALELYGYEACCPALELGLLADAAYTVVYDGPGATVFARERAGISDSDPGS